LALWIEATEKFIEGYTGRVFIADTVASVKVYDGEGKSQQKFDEFVSISKVEIGEDNPNLSPSSESRVEVESGDYRIYPNNRENKHTIQLKYNCFLRGFQNVHITAKWGYSVVCPQDLALAATVLTAGILINYTKSSGNVRSETIGKYSASYDSAQGWDDFKKVMIILNNYKKFHF
jgi:hypothetical protein